MSRPPPQPSTESSPDAPTVPLALIEALAGLTAQSGVEQLEHRLVRLVAETSDACGISLLRLDDSRHIRFELRCERGTLELRTSAFSPDDEVRKALLDAETTRRGPARVTCATGETTLHPMRESAQAPVYLAVTRPAPADASEHRLVEAVVEIYRNHCRMLLDAQTDQLTGLANRKTFDAAIERLYRELEGLEDDWIANDRRVGERGGHFLGILDIDHFKRVNDTYGHLYGDEVLLLISQLLKSSLRSNDMIFRFGGEEFVVLLRCTDLDACRRVLDRLRETIAIFDFPRVGQVTVSIGAVQLTNRVFHVTQMDHADQALYYSKRNGRNRTTFFEDMVARGEASTGTTLGPQEDVVFFD